MIFTTPMFFIFFIIFILIWWGIIPKKNITCRKIFLIIASYIFYSFTGIQWIATLFLTSIFTFFAARLIDKNEKHKKAIGVISVLILISQLVFWKYIPWAILTWNEFSFINENLYINPPEFLFPIGLSFFTFNALSLIIPVWLENKKSNSLLDTFSHIGFFPTLLAGPVLRYNNINYRWKESWSWENVEWTNGMLRIMIGATFKWVFASKCAEYSELAFNGMYENSMQVFIGVHAYALQIFFDFAGYSHMAIGFALLMGWKLPENFTHPYMSMSIQDFWRNWHRSLSYFFRDNLYIHLLGGNKNGKLKALTNAFLTMVVSGLWHGANITFIAWGAYHGLLLVIQNIFKSITKIQIPKLLSWFITFELVVIGWILFKAEDINSALKIFEQYLNFNEILQNNKEITLEIIFWFSLMGLVIFFEKRIMLLIIKISHIIDSKKDIDIKNLFVNALFLIMLSVWTYAIIKYGPTGVPDFIYNGF